jgi:hypothetical protein
MMAPMDKPISPQLADAFFAAVRGYVRWGYMGPEPGITNEENELIPISAVCRRVDTFTDRLPDEVCNALCFLTTQKHLKEKLDAERTAAYTLQSKAFPLLSPSGNAGRNTVSLSVCRSSRVVPTGARLLIRPQTAQSPPRPPYRLLHSGIV